MNPVAERLTGWPRRGRGARRSRDVFRIVERGDARAGREPGRAGAARGARRRAGQPHRAVARDGTERPIDDSAAPIRDARRRDRRRGARVPRRLRARGGSSASGRPPARARAPARERARGARGGRAREPAEGRLPRDGLARAAHAAERDPGLDADAPAQRRPIRTTLDRGLDGHRAQRAPAGAADRGPARREPHHLRQAAPRASQRVDLATVVEERASRPCGRPRTRRESRSIAASTRRSARSIGDPARLQQVVLEPALERGQVHARGRHASSVARRRVDERAPRSP